ncbi:unnamed protein product, partial [Ixodes pacificus]
MRDSKAHLEGEPGVVRQVSVGGGGARILRRGLLGRPDGLSPDAAQVSAVGLGPLLRVRVVMVAPGTPRGCRAAAMASRRCDRRRRHGNRHRGGRRRHGGRRRWRRRGGRA